MQQSSHGREKVAAASTIEMMLNYNRSETNNSSSAKQFDESMIEPVDNSSSSQKTADIMTIGGARDKR